MSTTFYPAWADTHVGHDERRAQLLAIAQRGADDLARAGLASTVELREGDPAEQLIRAAEADGADLIVVGTRGLSTLQSLVMGSVARKVLLHAPQSVLVVREARERVRSEQPLRVPTGAVLALG